jgi:hypothetical protein
LIVLCFRLWFSFFLHFGCHFPSALIVVFSPLWLSVHRQFIVTSSRDWLVFTPRFNCNSPTRLRDQALPQVRQSSWE